MIKLSQIKNKEELADEYLIFDNIFMDIDLKDIPIEKLRKQYVDFDELITPGQPIGDPLFFTAKKRHLYEGIDHSIDIEQVIKSLKLKYELEDWQIGSKAFCNNIKVVLVVPNINDNVRDIIEDMTSMGYYKSRTFDIRRDGMIYTAIKFDPRYPDDITSKVHNTMKFIYHLTPKYNFESIKESGFEPKERKGVFDYPPRIHFIKGHCGDDIIDELGQQLSESNNDSKNNGEYVLLTLDVSKIPNNVHFIYDSYYEHGICIEDEISFDCVIKIEDKKYKTLEDLLFQ